MSSFYLQLCVLYNVTYRFGYSLHTNCDNTFPEFLDLGKEMSNYFTYTLTLILDKISVRNTHQKQILYITEKVWSENECRNLYSSTV